MKVLFSATGYGQALIDDTSAAPDAQGVWFLATGTPVELKTPATESFQAALKKYAHYNGIPDFAWYEGWGATDLMIKGLELAGPNPTHAAVIKNLRGLKSYNVNGLLPNPINYSPIFGHDLPQQSTWVMQAEKPGFVATSSKPVCGTDIPGTSTASSS